MCLKAWMWIYLYNQVCMHVTTLSKQLIWLFYVLTQTASWSDTWGVQKQSPSNQLFFCSTFQISCYLDVYRTAPFWHKGHEVLLYVLTEEFYFIWSWISMSHIVVYPFFLSYPVRPQLMPKIHPAIWFSALIEELTFTYSWHENSPLPVDDSKWLITWFPLCLFSHFLTWADWNSDPVVWQTVHMCLQGRLESPQHRVRCKKPLKVRRQNERSQW